MNDLDLAGELAGAAERDLSALRGMDDPGTFADEIFGFHTQQATEKLLKAWLAARGETYPLSHDLATLLDLLKANEPDIDRFDALVEYTPYAVRLRYAATDPGSCALDRPQAIEQVEALLAAVRRRLADAESEDGCEP